MSDDPSAADLDESTDTVKSSAVDARRSAGNDAPAPQATRSETTWVARAQDGDAAAFEWLVHSYEAQLIRLAYRMLSDRGAAEDAVQDTFAIVWRRLPMLLDPQAFRSWLYRIATRRCLNILHRRSRERSEVTRGADFEQEIGRPGSLERGEGPEASAQVKAVHRGLDRALADLPPEQRICWVLSELHYLSYPQIASAVGVPLSTVRGRLARARHNLAKGMAAWR